MGAVHKSYQVCSPPGEERPLPSKAGSSPNVGRCFASAEPVILTLRTLVVTFGSPGAEGTRPMLPGCLLDLEKDT